MAASVRVEGNALNDPRLEELARVLGCTKYEALGRMVHLWSRCTDRHSYYATGTEIRGCLGPDGESALLACDLAEATPDGIYIKGTEGRIEWLAKRRAAASAGGVAKAKQAPAKRLPKAKQAAAKDLPNECGSLPSGSGSSSGSGSGSSSLQPPEKKKGADKPPKHPDLVRWTDWFFGFFSKHHGGTKPGWGPKESNQADWLLRRAGSYDELVRRAERLVTAECAWMTKGGWDLGTLQTNIDKLVPVTGGQQGLRYAQPDANKQYQHDEDTKL